MSFTASSGGHPCSADRIDHLYQDPHETERRFLLHYGCNGILFNHEFPIRGETFVTRKITRALARIKLGFQDRLYLGNMDAKRDWGHARDYVELMWLMLQQEKPKDYVIATGIQRSVRDFVTVAARELGMQVRWEGMGIEEKGVDETTGKQIVAVDPRYYRPTEVESLLGDASLARHELGWKPKTSFEEMVAEMAAYDLREAERDRLCSREGFEVRNYYE